MELNTGDTRYVSGENSYAQWYEPITVFKLGLPAFNICYKFVHRYFSILYPYRYVEIYFAKIVHVMPISFISPD